MLFHSVTEEDVVRRNCLAKSCPYCVRNSLLEDQNHSIVALYFYFQPNTKKCLVRLFGNWNSVQYSETGYKGNVDLVFNYKRQGIVTSNILSHLTLTPNCSISGLSRNPR